MKTIWKIAAVALVVGLLYVFTPPAAVRDATTGVITEEGNVDVFRMQIGDCFNDEIPLSAQPELDQAVELTQVQAIPCDDPHDNEVYDTFDLDLSVFPGEEQMATIAEAGCLERFEAFVGIEYEVSILDIFLMYPTSESFQDFADREVVCSVDHMEGRKLIGSMKESGM